MRPTVGIPGLLFTFHKSRLFMRISPVNGTIQKDMPQLLRSISLHLANHPAPAGLQRKAGGTTHSDVITFRLIGHLMFREHSNITENVTKRK